jgi:hypothetical protein
MDATVGSPAGGSKPLRAGGGGGGRLLGGGVGGSAGFEDFVGRASGRVVAGIVVFVA